MISVTYGGCDEWKEGGLLSFQPEEQEEGEVAAGRNETGTAPALIIQGGHGSLQGGRKEN